MKDIENIQDVKTLVDSFYQQVREDDLIGPVFQSIIANNWDMHLEKMYRFWQTVLLKEHTYYGSPFRPHANLPVEKRHFDRWITLFTRTVDTQFEGKKAEEAKWRAGRMAELFEGKIRYMRDKGEGFIL